MNTDSIIKSRRTQKVLAQDAWDISLNENENNSLINELLELAATAPYHHFCDSNFINERELDSCLPFRFYVLDAKNCRALASHIKENDIKTGKMLNMLHAADLMFIVNWLPEPFEGNKDLDSSDAEPFPFEGNLKNMEHIAAASAAIQNVLLGATARNIPNYWSSGGALRKEPLRSLLNIPMDEILLGALYLFPKDSEERNVPVFPGGLREYGKELKTWSKRIEI